MKKLVLFFGLGLLFIGCQEKTSSAPFSIVCTTGMLADAVTNLLEGVDSVDIHALMGPGTDPHLYKASQSDVLALSRGDLIVYNGLHLEGKMQSLFEKLNQERVFAAAEQLPDSMLINASDYAQAHDPHVWFDLSLWSMVCQGLSQRLQEALPQAAKTIAKNEQSYQRDLEKAHSWALNKMSLIPEKQRVLVTAHDAFKYFGQAYKIEVRGLQGISTTAEFGLRDISDLAQFIKDRGIKAVFVESSVSPKAIEAVREAVLREGRNLELGGELYSDALGAADSEAGTFLGMFYKNVRTIESSLL
ncbi:MAG: metal ABC transporter solute-binding protein, Zn/Mn family [Croceimicrobium sp.]